MEDFLKDKQEGMDFEQALKLYGEKLGEEIIKEAYKKDLEQKTSTEEMSHNITTGFERLQESLATTYEKIAEAIRGIVIPESKEFPKEI